MTNSRINPKVDAFLSKVKKWQEELEKLRTIVLDCGLTEELKWYQPCYTFIFLNPNNPKPGSQGLKNICSKFLMERD